MASHGQRFRRRALRRGYKVDEVDTFLDRVEATIAGEPVDPPVTAQEVHDVVFRVRFGGYDEWQVDLHLDRVERQLAEAADRGHAFGAGPRPGAAGGSPPMPQRPTPAGPGRPPEAGYRAFDETYAGETYAGQPYAEPEPTHGGLADRYHSDMTTEMPIGDHGGPPPGPPSGPPPGPPSGPPPGPPSGPPPGPPPGSPPGPPPGYPPGSPPGPPPGYPPGPPPGSPPYVPAGAHPGTAGQPPPPAGHGPEVGPGAPPEVQRVDQLRRSFQPRRFGSGYDRSQVDQLFEEVIAGMSGHGPLAVTENQLDPRRFDLVSGGYFEGDVDHALQEVREILRRR